MCSYHLLYLSSSCLYVNPSIKMSCLPFVFLALRPCSFEPTQWALKGFSAVISQLKLQEKHQNWSYMLLFFAASRPDVSHLIDIELVLPSRQLSVAGGELTNEVVAADRSQTTLRKKQAGKNTSILICDCQRSISVRTSFSILASVNLTTSVSLLIVEVVIFFFPYCIRLCQTLQISTHRICIKRTFYSLLTCQGRQREFMQLCFYLPSRSQS